MDIPVIIICPRYERMGAGTETGGGGLYYQALQRARAASPHTNRARRLPTEPERIEKGDLTLMPETRGAYADGKRVELTAKEFDLLLCLARHDGETVTRPMLLKEVWDYDDEEDTSRTVDSHIKRLRTKLGDSAGNPKYIQTVRGTGYRLIAGEK